jgi:hypothetical protein
MAWLIGAIITIGALLGAIKAIVEFFEWLKRRKEEDDTDRPTDQES